MFWLTQRGIACLRRIAQTCTAHAERLAPVGTFETRFKVGRSDGSIHEFTTVDEVFGVDNSEGKQVCTVMVDVRPADHKASGDWGIQTGFTARTRLMNSEAPLYHRVWGPTRDWVFLASSDLEDDFTGAGDLGGLRC